MDGPGGPNVPRTRLTPWIVIGAVLLGAAVLSEPLGWPLLAGGALVLTGAALANQPEAGPARPATSRAPSQASGT